MKLNSSLSLQVTPGADSSKKESPETVADYTLKLLKRRVPPAVPGAPLEAPHPIILYVKSTVCVILKSRSALAVADKLPTDRAADLSSLGSHYRASLD